MQTTGKTFENNGKDQRNTNNKDDKDKQLQIELKKQKYQESILANCRSVADFEKLEEVGEGTYGRVCKLF